MGTESADDNDASRTQELDDAIVHLLHTRCFEALEASRMSYIYTAQATCSNIMSTVVTARPYTRHQPHQKQQDKQQQQRPPSLLTPPPPLAVRNQEPSTHVYAQSCNPKKAKKKGRSQAQLPAFRRDLPALAIPTRRLHQELTQARAGNHQTFVAIEHDKFMKQLRQERLEKLQLETWAAIKIQACFRGFRNRPHAFTYQLCKRINNLANIRGDLSKIQQSLIHNEEQNARSDLSPWRKEIQHRANQKRDIKAKRERMHWAAAKIQACVRRFLALCGYAHQFLRHCDEVYLDSVIKIQGLFRGFRLRIKIYRVVSRLQLHAVVQIQSLIRGIQARERVCILRFEQSCERRRKMGERDLQFSLPSRTPAPAPMSSLKCLYEHRKTKAHLEFKSSKWKEERMYLRIHIVATKLFNRRLPLQRLSSASASRNSSKRNNRKPKSAGGTRRASSASLNSSRAQTGRRPSLSQSPPKKTSRERIK